MLTKIRKYQINLQLISLYPGSQLLTRLFKTFIHYIRNVVVFFPNACYRSYCEQYVLVRLSETISVFPVRPVWWRTSARTPVRRPSPSCTSSSLARVPRVTASTRLAWPTSRRKSSRAAIRRPASLRGAPCLSGYSGEWPYDPCSDWTVQIFCIVTFSISTFHTSMIRICSF